MKAKELRCIFVICLFVTFEHACTAVEISSPERNEKLTSVLEGWQNFENKVKYLTKFGVKTLAPTVSKHFGSMNLSDECMENMKHLISGMEEIKPWAMKFIDSSGKFFDGILVGSFSSLGSYDECLDIEVKNRDFNGEPLFRSQYCTVMMHPPLPPKPRYMDMLKVPEELKNFSLRDTAVAELSKDIHLFYVSPLRLGVCLPSGCSIDDVNKMARSLGRELSLEAKASRCEIKEDAKFTPSAIFVIILYSFFGFLVLIGSSIDRYSYHSKTSYKNIAIRVLLAFSFFTNYKRLSSPAPEGNKFNCLYGIRFLGAAWIILGHGYELFISGLIHGLKEPDRLMQQFTSQFVLNATLCVDTFMFIGGMLVCYVTFQKVNHHSELNVLMYIVHRIWRILPSYLFILMAIFIMHMLGSGPVWHEVLDPTLESCRKYWWANLLFMQNFYEVDPPCFFHFWYVAVDFQLYIFALVILLPLLRWPKIGLSLAVLTILGSALYSGIVTYLKDLPPTVLFTVVDMPTIMSLSFKLYFQPFNHAGPYAIGLLSGYLLSSRPKMKISSFMLALGWTLACVFTLSALQGVLPWYRGEDTSLATNIAYASFNRIVWTLGIAWMIICCATGNGGIINYVLSLRIFVPLGRISYLAYLVHFPMQYVFIGNIRTRIQSSTFFASWIFFGHIAVSFLLAFLVNMLVEAPFLNLDKICFLNREQNEDSLKITKGQDNFTIGVNTEEKGDITEKIGDNTLKNGDISENTGDNTENNGNIIQKNGDITPIPAVNV